MEALSIKEASKEEDVLRFILGALKPSSEEEEKEREEGLRKALFGERPRVFALVARYEVEPVGVCVYYYSFSTLGGFQGVAVDLMFVQDKWRGKGVDRAMICELVNKCVKEGSTRIQWNLDKEDKETVEFVKKLKAKFMPGWIQFQLQGQDLQQAAE